MKRRREIILLLTSVFIVVVAWIGFNIYHNANASTINETLTQEIINITPAFNTKIIERLKDRQYIDPVYTFPQKGSKIDNINASSSGKPVPTFVVPPINTSGQNSTKSGSTTQL